MRPEAEIRRYLDRDALTAGVTIITANKRLSRRLQQLWGELALADGETVWESPDILPWSAWLQRCWESALLQSTLGGREAPGMLLGIDQELALWERVITQSRAGSELLRPSAAAREAREAHLLQNAWRMRIPSTVAGDDVGAFLDWSTQYRTLCRRNDWIDEARLPDLLAGLINDALPAPTALHLVGFDEYTPQQEALIAAIEAGGGRVTRATPASAPGQVQRVALPDAEAEIVAAARWARGLLEQDPGLRIGIVVPDLAARRAQLARIFEDILQPASVLPAAADTEPPLFNLSAGLPLAQIPIIHDALRALELAGGECRLETAGVLLRSPFFAGAEQELDARALLDVRLRKRGDVVISLGRLIAEAGKPQCCCPLLADRLSQLQTQAAGLRDRRLRPSEWAECLLGLLGALGWPGERALDSDEYQAVDAWRDRVSGLSLLDAVLSRLDLGGVLKYLAQQAGERMFQPERGDTPVQILGLLEATGLVFDRLRIMGLHDEVWPPAPDPNPFLPLTLQRALGLPRSSAHRELEVAQRMLDQLLSAAPEVRLSHPLSEGDRSLLPSPMITAFPLVNESAADLAAVASYRDLIHAAGLAMPPEQIDDSFGPAIDGDHAGGGSQLFRLQAVCPFSAFARFRLNVRPLDEAVSGLDAAERGKLLHRVLDILWTELGDQQALLALDGAGRTALLSRSIEVVLEEERARRPQVFTAHFRELEHQRLMRQVEAWLDIERQRAPFVVEATEHKTRVSAGGASVDVIVDRIDRLADGGRVIIDYKTGRASPADWDGDRPDEPQLPLYSLLIEDDLRAMMFARIRAGDVNCIGIARDDGIAPKIRTADDWRGLLSGWRVVLERLGEEFRAGRAVVDPKAWPKSCQYCGLTSLCRINESTSPVGDDVPVADPEGDR